MISRNKSHIHNYKKIIQFTFSSIYKTHNKETTRQDTHKRYGGLQISYLVIRRHRRSILRPGDSTRRPSIDGLYAKTCVVPALHTHGEPTASTIMLRANERDCGERRTVSMCRFQQPGDTQNTKPHQRKRT